MRRSRSPAAAASAAQASSQEVTVTATKRTTTLQSTPLAVTPIGAEELDKQHVQTISDVVHLVPSFQATTEGDHGVITMTMRGIGNDSAKTEYADPEVATFVDGVYAPRAEAASRLLLFDMDGVEVLRGPQGTLWGRNSTAGAISFQTAKPDIGAGFYGNAQVEAGNYNQIGSRAAFNLPISNTFAMRVAVVHEQHDGYVDYQDPSSQLPSVAQQQQTYLASGGTAANFKPIDPGQYVQKGDKYNAQDQSAARVSALWQPSDSFKWNLSYEYFIDRGTPSMSLMQTPRDGQKFWSALIDTAPYLHRTSNTVRSRMDWNINDGVQLSYIAGYNKYSGQSDFDQDVGVSVPTSFTTNGVYQDDRTNSSHYKNWSQELNLKSTGPQTVDWIVGAYYGYENNDIRFDIPIMNGTRYGTVSWQGSFIQPKETVESYALFGQATWHLNDSVRLTGGLRWSHDDKENKGGINWGWAYDPTVPQLPIDPDTNPATAGSGFSAGHNDGHYTGTKATWLGRANWDLSKNFMAYASVSTGYKSGGLQDGGLHYGPETLTNYEVGTKNTLFDGAVHFNNSRTTRTSRTSSSARR
jgi:iron complex outermembrane receptor protein